LRCAAQTLENGLPARHEIGRGIAHKVRILVRRDDRVKD
jgi:hypothetical protein